MAWSRIQSVKTTPVAGNAALSIATSFGSSVTAGNRVFVYTGHQTNTSLTDVNTPTDNQSNTYTKLIGGTIASGGDKFWTDIWTAVTSATGTLTITVTSPATTGGELGWTAEEYSGLDASAGTGCLDVSAAGTGNYNVNATASSGTTAATAAAGQLALSTVADWGFSATWTVSGGTGFTKNTAASIDANGTTSIGTGNRLSGAGSAENCVWSAGVVDTDVAVVAVIKLATSAAPSGGKLEPFNRVLPSPTPYGLGLPAFVMPSFGGSVTAPPPVAPFIGWGWGVNV